MKVSLSVATIFAVAFGLASSALAATSSPAIIEMCGSGSEILNSTTFEYEGKEITFGMATCPDLQAEIAAKRGPTSLSKRQVNVCTDDSCAIQCATTGAQPFIFDCQTVANALEARYPQEFLVQPGHYAYASAYTCAFGFFNLDVSEYNVCYSNFGFNSIIAADHCFQNYPSTTATPGAYCLSPGYVGNDWAIKIYNPN
ncbi:hypothetical protein EVG20_g4755 [Dentipellis fragilis]|uniref:Uncharacterized protein n=1 Tax=Dentipellis fragilis TaxID=205917 RepID=A0A4Y9YXN5_9AGAM|nr:hypothetical protein EVG20_g4755 [Dentipellis fragilis]